MSKHSEKFGDIFKLLVLSDQQAKTPKYLTYSYIKGERHHIVKLEKLKPDNVLNFCLMNDN